MRKRLQYAFAAAIGCVLGAWIAVDDVLLGGVLGAGVGMLIVLFVHVYPHVGYAEQKLPSANRSRRTTP